MSLNSITLSLAAASFWSGLITKPPLIDPKGTLRLISKTIHLKTKESITTFNSILPIRMVWHQQNNRQKSLFVEYAIIIENKQAKQATQVTQTSGHGNQQVQSVMQSPENPIGNPTKWTFLSDITCTIVSTFHLASLHRQVCIQSSVFHRQLLSHSIHHNTHILMKSIKHEQLMMLFNRFISMLAVVCSAGVVHHSPKWECGLESLRNDNEFTEMKCTVFSSFPNGGIKGLWWLTETIWVMRFLKGFT